MGLAAGRRGSVLQQDAHRRGHVARLVVGVATDASASRSMDAR